MVKALGKITYGIFIALLIGVAGLFLVSLLPIPGNIEIKIVKSGSMEPTIMTGAIVVVKPASSYAVNDVVMFGKDTKREIPTTHRIIGMSDENGARVFSTKGDANEEADPQPVPLKEVIGKVVFDMPYAGYVLDFARKPLGFAFLVGVPALMIILDELWKIFDEVRRMRRRKRGEDDEDDSNGVTARLDSVDLSQEVVSFKKSVSSAEGKVAHKTHVLPRQLISVDGIIPASVLMAYQGARLVATKEIGNSVYFSPKTFVVALMSLGSLFGLLSVGVGGTISYFNDTERSIGNIFRAGSVDFRLSATQDVAGRFAALAVSEPMTDEEYKEEEIQVGSETFLLTVGESDDSEPLVYSIEAVLEGGAGCEVLELEASLGDYSYNGLFKDFSRPTTDEMGDWMFTIYIPEDAEGIAPDALCAGELVFRAYPKGKEGGVLSRIFMDEEEYYFTIKNYPEFVPEAFSTESLLVAPQGEVAGESTTTEDTILPEEDSSSGGSGEVIGEESTTTPEVITPDDEATTTPDVLPSTEEETASSTPEEVLEETPAEEDVTTEEPTIGESEEIVEPVEEPVQTEEPVEEEVVVQE